MKERTANGAVRLLASLAEKAVKDFARLDADPATPSERIEEAALSIDSHVIALSSIAASTASARAAKARVARLMFGDAPTADKVAISFVERTLAASVVGDSIRAASSLRSAA